MGRLMSLIAARLCSPGARERISPAPAAPLCHLPCAIASFRSRFNLLSRALRKHALPNRNSRDRLFFEGEIEKAVGKMNHQSGMTDRHSRVF